MPGFEAFGREHPAFVHLPIAASLLLMPGLVLWVWKGETWRDACRLLAWAAFSGGLLAALSGLGWARSMDLIPSGGFMPRPGLLATHEALAVCGVGPGLAALLFIEGKRPRLALVSTLAWAALWGLAGHWGGRMVFPAPDTVSSLAEAPWATSVSPKSS
jgi:hypothetical protein